MPTSASNSLTDNPNDDWAILSDHSFTSTSIERWREEVAATYSRLSRVPYERIRFVTIIADVQSVEPCELTAFAKNSFDNFNSAFRRRCRKKLRGLRVAGVFEVDLISPHGHLTGRNKAALLQAFGIGPSNRKDSRVALCHIHMVVDLGAHSDEKFNEEMRAEFNGPYRVHTRSLFTDRSVRDNVSRLSSYSTKLKVAYSDAWNRRTTKFYAPFEYVWQAAVGDALRTVGLENLVLRMNIPSPNRGANPSTGATTNRRTARPTVRSASTVIARSKRSLRARTSPQITKMIDSLCAPDPSASFFIIRGPP